MRYLLNKMSEIDWKEVGDCCAFAAIIAVLFAFMNACPTHW